MQIAECRLRQTPVPYKDLQRLNRGSAVSKQRATKMYSLDIGLEESRPYALSFVPGRFDKFNL